MSSPAERAPARTRINAVSLVITALGAVAVAVAFLALPWFHAGTGGLLPDGGTDPTFSDLHNALAEAHTLAENSGATQYVHFGVSPYYFSWLGWALLIASLMAAALTAVPAAAALRPVRALAALPALAGLALTLWALDLVRVDAQLADQLGSAGAPTYTDYLRHSRIGAWTAVAGFMLLVLGALAGPRQSTQP